ncbi:MAG: competence/damage-inducible protein A [Phycisphaerales bacterium]|nr:competence/damage-inducible protein A [Phycisphaerales bacterium]
MSAAGSTDFPHAVASIIASGDELVLGQKLDTNSQCIADRLVSHGLQVREHVTVPDDQAALVEALRRAAATSQLVIVTGGLGPTADDLTRQALAELLGENLVMDEDALRTLEGWFTSRGRTMPPGNRVQAMRPASARMLTNEHGTAPGLHAVCEGRCDLYCLPGPPREMIPLLEREVMGHLRVAPALACRTQAIHTFGRGESDVAALLADLMDRARHPLVGTTASLGVVSVRIRASGPSAEALIAQTAAEVRRRLGPVVLDGEHLAAEVITRLRAAGRTVGTVESCTGGMLGQFITEVPGASDVFAGGLVTYANEQKVALAGVPKHILDREGAVSRACAVAMAEGGRERLGTDHALSITGIAGPDGGTPGKPVGTVWIALASGGAPTDARRFLFRGSRSAIRTWSGMSALAMLRLRLIGADMRLLNQQE